MHKNLLKQFIGLFILASTPFIGIAQNLAEDELLYSYSSETNMKAFGSAKAETYDVAIHLPEKALVGKTVTGVRIPFTTLQDISDLKIWMTKELKLEGMKTNLPDICSQSAELTQGQYIEVMFENPYTITDDGVYVGYSFTVDKIGNENMTPLWCTTLNPREGGFYLHSSYSYRKWASQTKTTGMNLGMQVIIKGIDPYSVGAVSFVQDKSQINKEISGLLKISNQGTKGVSEIEYEYTLGDNNGSGKLTIPTVEDFAKGGRYNASYVDRITLPAVSESGSYPFNIKIVKVNRQPNANTSSELDSEILVSQRLAKKRPVYEEFTGTWCQNCVRGIASLNYMSENFEDFIGIAYHNNDAMEVFSQSEFPVFTSGYPYGLFDRELEADAYYGLRSDKKYGLDEAWYKQEAIEAPADIDVEAEWTDEDKTQIKVKSRVSFLNDEENTMYRLAYVLLHDEMKGTGSRWTQKNAYLGRTEYLDDPWMKPWVEGKAESIFNEVMVAASAKNGSGISGSIPQNVKADEPVLHEYIFDLKDVKNRSGQSLIQDKTKLRVVVMLQDLKKKILNANKAFVPGYEGELLEVKGNAAVRNPSTVGIDTINPEKNESAYEVAYYNLSGQRISEPTTGIYIVRMSDGSVKKVVKK